MPETTHETSNEKDIIAQTPLAQATRHRDILLHQFGDERIAGSFSPGYRDLRKLCEETDMTFGQRESQKKVKIRHLRAAKNGQSSANDNGLLFADGKLEEYGRRFDANLEGLIKIFDRNDFKRVIDAFHGLEQQRAIYLEELDDHIKALEKGTEISAPAETSLERATTDRNQLLNQFGNDRLAGSLSESYQALRKNCSEADMVFSQRKAVRETKILELQKVQEGELGRALMKSGSVLLVDGKFMEMYRTLVSEMDGMSKILDRKDYNKVLEAMRVLEEERHRYLESLDQEIQALEQDIAVKRKEETQKIYNSAKVNALQQKLSNDDTKIDNAA